MKLEKMDYRNLLILLLIGIFIILITLETGNMYGATVDWIDQHWAFPEYFRELFYKTGNLIPNFAMNIGGGQNIFNFAYYGLLSPIILVSYLLPFMSMVDYIMTISILSIFISTYLIYKWLRNNKFSALISFIGACLFITASPIIAQSHKQIMFVNYFPFLLLALIGVDKYITKNRSSLMIISIFLMIMTNYYYSVCSLLVIGIYGIFKYLDQNKFVIKDFIKFLIIFVLKMFIGIFMASIILFPVINTIVTGDGRTSQKLGLLELLRPNFDLGNILYGRYSLGMTALAILALIYSFVTKKKNYIFIGLTISLIFFIPIFCYLLNGALYVRAKVLIPFIPLLILLIAHFISDLLDKKIEVKSLLILLVNLSFVFLIAGYHNYFYYIDVFLLNICIEISIRKKNAKLFYIPVILFAIIISIVSNKQDKLIERKEFNKYFDKDKIALINEVTKEDNDFYRFNDLSYTLPTVNKIYNTNYYQTSLYSSTYNNYYDNSIHDKFNNSNAYRNNFVNAQSNNIMISTYFGVKYITDKANNTSIGYKKVDSKNKYNIFRNENVYSLGYLNKETLNTKIYDKLKFPFKSEALLKYIITPDGKENYDTDIEKIKLDYNYTKNKNIEIYKNESNYIFNVKKPTTLKLNLNNDLDNKILFISFDMNNQQSCSKGDLTIKINGISNVLTCKEWIYNNNNHTFEYTISSNNHIDTLEVTFSKGYFDISNLKTYTLDYQKIIDYNNSIEKINDLKVKNDKIVGNINNLNDGYFVFTIPYDKGFNFKVNNKIIKYQNLNDGYIGVYLKKGHNNIELSYETPFLKLGKVVSLIMLFIFIGNIILEKIILDKK